MVFMNDSNEKLRSHECIAMAFNLVMASHFFCRRPNAAIMSSKKIWLFAICNG